MCYHAKFVGRSTSMGVGISRTNSRKLGGAGAPPLGRGHGLPSEIRLFPHATCRICSF